MKLFPNLMPGKIALFFADLSETDELRLTEIEYWLDSFELQQLRRFRFAHQRRQYLASHGLLRYVLAQYVNLPEKDLLFFRSKYGKPGLAKHPDLAFNLSHSQDIAILAVAKATDLGADVERINEKISIDSMINSNFHPGEIQQLALSAKEERCRHFYEYWTLKESMLKALGTGLSTPLDQVCLDFSKRPHLRMVLGSELQTCVDYWFMSLINPIGIHGTVVALAARFNEEIHEVTIEGYRVGLNNWILVHQEIEEVARLPLIG